MASAAGYWLALVLYEADLGVGVVSHWGLRFRGSGVRV